MYTAVSKLKEWRCRGMQDICATKLQMETYPSLFLGVPPSWPLFLQWESEEILSRSTREQQTHDSSVFISRGEEREKKGDAKRLRNFRNTSFCTGQSGGCTLVDTSVRNACPWGIAISISPLPLASLQHPAFSRSVRSAAYQQRGQLELYSVYSKSDTMYVFREVCRPP